MAYSFALQSYIMWDFSNTIYVYWGERPSVALSHGAYNLIN